MLSIEEINILGQIFDVTWGRTSTPSSPTHVVRCKQIGDGQVCIDFTTVVTFASDRGLRDQKEQFENESAQVTKDAVKRIKKEFKDTAGRALKLKETSTDDSIEIINMSAHSPRKTAYYRRKSIFDVD